VTGWTAKRFWTAATAAQAEGGWTVLLDGRRVKTPAKAPLVLPTKTMAQAAAAEWDAQTGTVKPDTMPVTRAANSALDKVTPQFAEVVAMLAAYGGTDLLCYRAAHPAALVARQTAWDTWLDWAAERYHARLAVTTGVVPVGQAKTALDALRAPLAAMTPFELTAAHDLIALTGSLVLGLAVTEGRLTVDDAWRLSRIDEDFQAEHWGVDEEAAAFAAARLAALQQAGRFWGLCLSQS
jgi:chaperone required for assembly of F1-ATPase